MRWAWWKPALGAAVAALFAARWLAEFTADRLWAETVGATAAHTDIALLRVALGLSAFLIAAAWYTGNLLLLYRQIGAVQVPRQVGNLEIVEHVPRRYLLIGAVVTGLALAFVTSLGKGDLWTLRAVSDAEPLGVSDPVLGRDVGYYLFDLPWERALHGYATWLCVVALLLLGLLYTAIGAVRRQERRLAFLPFARWHLAALSGTLALALAWGYALEPAELVAGLHDVPYDRILVEVRIPAAAVMVALAIGVAAASIVWMRVDRTRIPAAAWAALFGASFLAHFVVPPAVAGGRTPEGRAHPELEAAQADALRAGLGAAVDTVPVPLAVPDLQFPSRHEQDLAQTPVWDDFVLPQVLNRFAQPATPGRSSQGHFFTADLTVLPDGSGTPVPVFLAVRESDLSAPAGPATAPLGAVAVHGSRLADGGLPRFVPDLSEPDSSVGRSTDIPIGAANWFTPTATGYALVSADEGPLGIPLRSLARRVVVAWALQAPALLSARRARDGMLVVAERAVAARLARYAPFARFGAAWPAVQGGRLIWLAWGYVAAEAYPLGTRVSWRGAAVRYLHAGFLGTVDAGTGQVRVYLAPEADPVSRAWRDAMPELVRLWSDMPPGLRTIQRYPEESFTAQLQVLRDALGRGRPADPFWWAGPSVGDTAWRLRLRAVDEVRIEPRVAAVFEGVMRGDTPVLRMLRYPQPFRGTGPSALERTLAAAAPVGAEYAGRLRLIPFADGAVAVQTFYADSGTVAGVVMGWADAVGVGPTLAQAVRGIGPTARATSGSRAGGSLDAARQWFRRLDEARARADWSAFGEAWDSLRASLGLPADSGRRLVEHPIPRD